MNRFHPVGRLLASSLLLALLGMLGTAISTQPARAMAGLTTQPISPNRVAVNQLLGQWQAKDPSSGKIITLIFTPENKLLIVLPARDGSSVAIKMGYQVNLTTQPMQLDMILSGSKAMTIFEFTSQGKLRLELDGITPGNTRPYNFTAKAVLLSKISDVTTLPKNVQVVEPEKPKDKPRQNIAEQFISILNRYQQAYYLKTGKLAANLEELGIITNLDSESYRYQMVLQGEKGSSAIITAQAKISEMPSYIGAVFVSKINGKATTVAGICATNQPSTSPPTMPQLPNNGSSEIQCPPGSHLVQSPPK